MKHNFYSVYDEKAAAFLPPFIATTDAVASRMFADAVTDENHQFGKHAADYTLFKIGDFDDSTGEVAEWANVSLGNGLQVFSQIMRLKEDEGHEV